MDSVAILLVLAALVCGGVGLVFSLGNLMFGLGLIGVGCLLAILARMAQASGHHQEVRHPVDRSMAGDKLDSLLKRRHEG